MIEVRYNRRSAWLQVLYGVILAGMGIWLLCFTIAGLLLMLIGAVIIHVASLRLREHDVLLRLTPKQLWTKEFGWQPWSKLIVSMQYDRNGYTLEIHKPSDFTPRFYARVSTLTIDKKDLLSWVERYATAKR
jgi:hypothetical protein